MKRYPVQVTSFCEEYYADKWRSYLKGKGYETETKSKVARVGRKKVTLYAIFRKPSKEEIEDVKNGKYALTKLGSFDLGETASAPKVVTDCLCSRCGKSYTRVGVANKNDFCSRCRYVSRNLVDFGDLSTTKSQRRGASL
jgi:hypothetical protein